MIKENKWLKEATVTEVLPDAKYRVTLDNGFQLLAYASGKMKKRYIKIMKKDRVSVVVSVDDHKRGRIIHRHKTARPEKKFANHESQIIHKKEK